MMEKQVKEVKLSVDKVGFVLYGVGVEEERWLRDVGTLVDAMMKVGEIRWRPNQGSYRRTLEFATGNSGILVQLGKVRTSQRGICRFELNPNRLSVECLRKFNNLLDRLLMGRREELMTQARLNRLDFAADVSGVSMMDVLVGCKYVHQFTTVSKLIRASDRRLEAVSFGSFGSDHRNVVYDKHTEEIVDALTLLARKSAAGTTSLTESCVREFKELRNAPAKLRFEVRCKKMNGSRLSELRGMENRFGRFRVVDVSALNNVPEPVRTLFLCTCREIGTRAALELMKEHRLYRRLAAAIVPAEWWQPETYWGEGVDALIATGIFPSAAFRLDPCASPPALTAGEEDSSVRKAQFTRTAKPI